MTVTKNKCKFCNKYKEDIKDYQRCDTCEKELSNLVGSMNVSKNRLNSTDNTII